MAVTKKNPNWTYDETILALNLYFECKRKIPSKSDNRIDALSKLLRSHPFHKDFAKTSETFRNPAGICCKLKQLNNAANSSSKDATTGMWAPPSKMDKQVWEDYGDKIEQVKSLAASIKEKISTLELHPETSEDETFLEGKLIMTVHKERERSPKLRESFLKKRQSLKCDICGYVPNDLPEAYKESVFEIHHIKPLAVSGAQETSHEDLALLCANCHRLIHHAISIRKEQWIDIKKAKTLLKK